MSKVKYLVTGASGFIGSRIFNELKNQKLQCIGIGRRELQELNYIQCDLNDPEALRKVLKGITCVVHCAGYAHAFKTPSREASEKTWLINYMGTKNVIEISAEMGVKKYINLSSVKAMGDPGQKCVDESWELKPDTDYGKSKLAAEYITSEVGRQNLINVINLRLSMVYGFGGKGNMERMANLISKGLFPPLPETKNHRSLIHVDDVVDLILQILRNENILNNTFIVTGPDSPSGREIYDEIRNLYGFKKQKIQIPRFLFEYTAEIFDVAEKFLGKQLIFNKDASRRLLESAWYSPRKIENYYGWRGKVSLKDGLREMIYGVKNH